MDSENSELALVKLMELFNHSSVAITKRYLGLRQEEILQTYDWLTSVTFFEVKYFYRACQILLTLKLHFHIFLLNLLQFRSSNGKEGHFDKKVLLKLSSCNKSRKFERCEDDNNSTTSLVSAARSGLLHTHWCGLLFYPQQMQCEKPHQRIKQ